MKGLTGLVLQNKHCHTAHVFFFVFSQAQLVAFREAWGLNADSNRFVAYSLWARWPYTHYKPGWSNNGVGVNTSNSRILAYLPVHVLNNAMLNTIRQIVMDNNSGIH